LEQVLALCVEGRERWDSKPRQLVWREDFEASVWKGYGAVLWLQRRTSKLASDVELE
jgi:hypothetical protein